MPVKIPSGMVNFYRNLKGRYDLMIFFFRWDRDYRKDMMTTMLAFGLFVYSVMTWDSYWDFVAIFLEACIMVVHLGGEMSIMPADYRPKQGGAVYSARLATHIAYDEESYEMSGVRPAPAEAGLGFANPIRGLGITRESPLVSDKVDDSIMLRDKLPYREVDARVNFLASRHQLRYIALRVLNKKTHTTNGAMLALFDDANALVNGGPVTVRKASYFDGLLTAEAFRSRIFRGNLHNEPEVYTDLTTYFPVTKETEDGRDILRLKPDFHHLVSTHMGITTLLLTENNRVAMLRQGTGNAIGGGMVCLGGSGSFDYNDLRKSGRPDDLRDVIRFGMAREVCEETGLGPRWLDEVVKNTIVTGFFRWLDRSGKPEFVGLTRAGNVPYFKNRMVDSDEITAFDEVPVTVNRPEDFHDVFSYIVDNKVTVALSSVMALHRMKVIAGYGAGFATETQKSIYDKIAAFLKGA